MDLFLPCVISEHIVIALDLAVVELPLLVRTAAEIMLELRLRSDDELFPAVGELQMPSQCAVQPLGALLFQHPLAVGRVADQNAAVAGQAHFGGIAVFEGDAVGNAGFSGIGHGKGDTHGVIV